jgi:hypothetical protein
MPSPRNRALSLSVAHPFFCLWAYPVLCYTWLARPLTFDARAAHISLLVMSVPQWRPEDGSECASVMAGPKVGIRGRGKPS